jgi:hypothetical protein
MAQAHHAEILTKDSHKRQLLLGRRVAALAPTAALRAQTHDVFLPQLISVVAASAPAVSQSKHFFMRLCPTQQNFTVQPALYAATLHVA